MNLGWCDFCLRVTDAHVSREFYEKLGFVRVEGDDAEGWAVMVKDEVRIGLFQPEYMGGSISINFRGGDVAKVCRALSEQGVEIQKGPTFGKSGGVSAELRDPDGYMIFLDTAPGEIKRMP